MLFLTRKYPPSVGGMENVLYQMAKNMPDDNLDIHVVALGKSQKNLIWFFPYIVIYTIFNAHKYDYLFIGDGLLCLCGKIAKAINPRIKRIIIIHGLDITYPNPIYQLYLKSNLKRAADIYACNSHYTEKTLNKWGIQAQDGAFTITHGIDIHKYDGMTPIDNNSFRQKYHIPNSALIILTSGRLVRRKGVEWFIHNVMPHLNNAIYLVVGEGEEREQISSAITSHSLDNKVLLLGRVSDQDLLDCYFNVDLFVMPNIHIENNVEGFGLVALEASLAGTLVIASDADGIPDAVIDKKNGILIKSGDSKAFIEVINDIEVNRKDYANKAREYQAYTKTNCSWRNTCQQMKAALRQDINQKYPFAPYA